MVGARWGSGEEEDFADAAFFCGGVGFGGLFEGEHAVDGDFEAAGEHVFGEGAEFGGVGVDADGSDLDGGVHFGVGGWADDGGEGAAGFDLGDEFLGDFAVYGVGDGVDEAELLECGVVVEGEDGVGAEFGGLLELGFADSGDDDGAGFAGGPDGGAADASDGSGDEDGLAGEDFCTAGDELLAGEGDEGQGGGFDEVEAIGEEGEVGGFDGDKFGVGTQAEGDDLVSRFEVGDAGAELADGAGDVPAEDGGELDREARFGGAAAHFVVDGVDARGGYADEDLAFRGDGVGDVFIFEVFGRAVFVQDDGFHERSSWPLDA